MPASLVHLQRMTDDTGMLEHALGPIPRRSEGYTTDDNARALWLVSALVGQSSAYQSATETDLHRLATVYLSFIDWALAADGSLHNNFSYDRRPEHENSSDDCLGRTLWGLAAACDHLDGSMQLAARLLFAKAASHIDQMNHLRGEAYGLAAASRQLDILKKMKEHTAEDAVLIHALPAAIYDFTHQLLAAFAENSRPGWYWFEPQMTYSNGILPWALYKAYQMTDNPEILQAARDALNFLIEKMTTPQGWLRPIGNRGWCDSHSSAQWDQQPVELLALAMATSQGAAYDSSYSEIIEKCRAWFRGANDLQTPLANPDDGSCCDGLQPSGVNRNCGAESTLAYLLTEAIGGRNFTKK